MTLSMRPSPNVPAVLLLPLAAALALTPTVGMGVALAGSLVCHPGVPVGDCTSALWSIPGFVPSRSLAQVVNKLRRCRDELKLIAKAHLVGLRVVLSAGALSALAVGVRSYGIKTNAGQSARL